MKIIFEVSSTNYEKDLEFLTNSLEDLQKLCETSNGYQLSKPMTRFGWTFFKLWLKPELFLKIEEHFADMIKKAKGSKQNEKFTNFLSDFFESKDCNVKLKMTEED